MYFDHISEVNIHIFFYISFKIEHHIASAMTIFQFFYGVLQQLQIDESRKNTLNSRKWILVKQFRNLEFKLRNLTETTFRTAVIFQFYFLIGFH